MEERERKNGKEEKRENVHRLIDSMRMEEVQASKTINTNTMTEKEVLLTISTKSAI